MRFLFLLAVIYTKIAYAQSAQLVEAKWGSELSDNDLNQVPAMNSQSSNDLMKSIPFGEGIDAQFGSSTPTSNEEINLDQSNYDLMTVDSNAVINGNNLYAQCSSSNAAAPGIMRRGKLFCPEVESDNGNDDVNERKVKASDEQYDEKTTIINEEIAEKDAAWDRKYGSSLDISHLVDSIKYLCSAVGGSWWWIPLCCLGPERQIQDRQINGVVGVVWQMNCENYIPGRPRCKDPNRRFCCHRLSNAPWRWGFFGIDCIHMSHA